MKPSVLPSLPSLSLLPIGPVLLGAGLLGLALLGGCAAQRYEPLELDPAARQAHWLAVRSDDPALRDALARQGIDVSRWPLPAWDLDALGALALTRHPEIAVAQAALRQREAARAVAREGPRLTGVETTVEHHSLDGAGSSPWTLGVVLDALLTGDARRAAQADAADALALEAVQQAAQTAWQVRQQVSGARRALHAAQQHDDAAQATLKLQRELLAAQQARLTRGATDALALHQARNAEGEAALQAAQARDQRTRARLALAAALGLAPEALDGLTLRLDDLDAEPPSPPALELQRAALLNRLELRAALARFAAADAQLKLELARQWPALVLKPGYAWDQGDNRWSLGLALELPPGGRNQAAIAQAEAQRTLEAERCLALQAGALAALAEARQRVDAATEQQALADARWSAAQGQRARAERRLVGGEADRLELLAARLAEAQAQQQRADAHAERWAALGALEDTVQQPLSGRRTALATTPNLTTLTRR